MKALLLKMFPFPEIDDEGVIEPDTDEPQEMGIENAEVNKSLSIY